MKNRARWERLSVKVGLAACAVVAILALAVGYLGAQGAGRAAGGGAAQGGGRGGREIAGDPILVGTIDVHAHQGPDKIPRPFDFLDAARYAKFRGMRGLVFKMHGGSTAVQAYIARKEVPGLEAFGLIDLNWTFGGMNPAAVEYFASISMPGAPPEGYGRVVMMGSDDTVAQLQATKSTKPPMYVAKNGQVVPEAKAVIAMIKQKNLSMTTGHNSAADALLLMKEAIAQGINPVRLSVTHANYTPAPAMTVDEMKRFAALGTFVELCSSTERAFTPEQQKALDGKNDDLADAIKQVGADHIIMETDVGQLGNEWHPDALAAFIRNMRARGVSAADTDKMTKENPAKFLGVSPPAETVALR